MSLLIYSSPQGYIVVFHCRLSYSKFPQVSKNVLNIQMNFNNVVGRIVSIRSPMSISSSPFSIDFGENSKYFNHDWCHPLTLWQGLSTYLFFRFLCFVLFCFFL